MVRPVREISHEVIERIKNMVSNGDTQLNISRSLGISVSRVQRFLKKLGINTLQSQKPLYRNKPPSPYKKIDDGTWSPETNLKERDPLLERLRKYHG